MKNGKSTLLKSCPSTGEVMDYLLHLPSSETTPDRLLPIIAKFHISRRDIARLERRASEGLPERGTVKLSKHERMDKLRYKVTGS